MSEPKLRKFQSSPGHVTGRCLQRLPGLPAIAGVSILARSRDRALPRWVFMSSTLITSFQSSPGHVTGRCLAKNDEGRKYSEFQSSPGHVTGRCVARSANRVVGIEFQSSPGHVTGRCYTLQIADSHSLDVSILARSRDRALPAARKTTTPPIRVSILARSRDRALPCRLEGLHADQRFQSSPGHVTGRCIRYAVRTAFCCRFNPRPVT